MASLAFLDGFLLLNAVNYSTWLKKISLKVNGEELDDTAFGDTYHSRLIGLKDFTLDLDWNQDFAVTSVDDRLWPLFGTVQTFEVRPASGARAVTNPAYTGSVLVSDYSPVDGSVGDLLSLSTSWKCAATLLRQTA